MKNRDSTLTSLWLGLGILIVENETDLASQISPPLIAAGHDVRITRDANDALEIISRYTPDIAIVDLDLPDIPGAKLVRLMRKKRALRECRFIAIARDSDADCSQVGAFDAYLHKSTAAVEVIGAVANLDPRPSDFN